MSLCQLETAKHVSLSHVLFCLSYCGNTYLKIGHSIILKWLFKFSVKKHRFMSQLNSTVNHMIQFILASRSKLGLSLFVLGCCLNLIYFSSSSVLFLMCDLQRSCDVSWLTEALFCIHGEIGFRSRRHDKNLGCCFSFFSSGL